MVSWEQKREVEELVKHQLPCELRMSRLWLVDDVALMEGRIYTLSVYRLGHGGTQLTPYTTLPRAALEPVEQAVP